MSRGYLAAGSSALVGALAQKAPPLLFAFAQLAEILRHGIAVALRRGFAAGTADAAIAAGLLHFAAQLHFHLLYIAQRGLDALAQQRIVIQRIRIELPEIADQVVDVASCVGVAAVLLLQLLQALEGASIGGLDIRVADRSAAIARVVDVAAKAAVVVTAIGVAAASLLTTLLSALLSLTTLLALLASLLTALLPALLTNLLTLLPSLLALTLLSLFSLLPVARKLSRLALLSGLLAALPVLRPQLGCARFHLLPQLLHLTERILQGFAVLAGFVVLAAGAILTHLFADLIQLVAQVVESGGELRFRHRGVLAHAAPDVIGVALHVARDLRLLHVAERLPHLAGRFPLGGHQVADSILHSLFELLDIFYFGLVLIGQASRLLAGHVAVGLRVGAAQVAFELLLLFGEIRGLLRQIVHLSGRLLAAHAGKISRGLIHAVRRAPRSRIALRPALLGCRLAHVLLRLLQAVERLLELLGIGAAQPLIFLRCLLLTLLLLPALRHLP